MNFIFSLALFSSSLWARDVILVSYNHYGEKAKLTKKILEEKIHLPGNIINLSWREYPCETERESDFHICIDESGEMIVLKRNEALLKSAFSIFQKGYEEREDEDSK